MRAELKCTDPERWVTVPDFEANDDEILKYLEHLERCPFHSKLENRELQILNEDFETARELAPNRQLPLSAAAQDDLLNQFEEYLTARRESRVDLVGPDQASSRRKRSWFPSFRQVAFATSIAFLALLSIAIWKRTN